MIVCIFLRYRVDEEIRAYLFDVAFFDFSVQKIDLNRLYVLDFILKSKIRDIALYGLAKGIVKTPLFSYLDSPEPLMILLPLDR